MFLVGLILIVVEVFVPGFGIFAISGAVCILLSLFLTLGADMGALNIMAGGVVVAIVASC